MKRLIILMALLSVSLMVAAPLTVNAAGKKPKSEVVMKMGNKVHLFHSGKVDAQKEITIGDVLTVYRLTDRNRQQREVGQLKIISFIDSHYFEAEITKGEVKVGDIAIMNDTSLLVQPAR